MNTDGYAVLPSDYLEAKDILELRAWIASPRRSFTAWWTAAAWPRSSMPGKTYRLKFYPTPTVTASDEMRMIYYFDPGRLTDAALQTSCFLPP